MMFGRIIRVNSLLTTLGFRGESGILQSINFFFLNPLAFSYFCKAF